MTTPYGQQPPGQQPQPGGEPPSPFGRQAVGEQSSPFGQQPPQGQQSPFGQQPGQQQPFGQAPGGPPPFGQAPPAPFGQASPYGPAPSNYAHWGKRIAAFLLDFSPWVVAYLIGLLVMLVADQSAGEIVAGAGGLLFFGFNIWNRWIRMGTTGQSLGKKIMKIKLVKETTGEPLGVGMTIVREICHFLDNALCGLGYWWPLWDQKRQTFADKIITTVVLPVDEAPAGAQPFGQQQPGFPAPQSQPFPAPPTPFGQPGRPAQGGQPFGQPQSQPPQPSPFGQQPQQPSPFGQQFEPQGTPPPSPESQTEPGFGEAEPTQVIRPGEGQQPASGFDEAEPTQKITPDQLRQLPGAGGPNQPGPQQQ